MYIHELPDWPRLDCNRDRLGATLAAVRHRQGRLIGHMEALGFNLRQEAVLGTLAADVLKSSEIEGVRLDAGQVRSSIARRLGMDIGALKPADRDVEGVVEMMLDATRLDGEMTAFLDWFNADDALDPVLKAGLAHLRFVTVHPFDDGNGRIARALTDMLLACSERSAQRFCSMSAQIREERAAYYDILERTEKGTLDVTPWMEWFLGCLDRASARC